ncbi:sigma factor-like helix-turn-helix DNA-binding protein [Streptomyces sp. NPDC054951]
MSIVAERPVSAQVRYRTEAERNARRPVLTPETRDRMVSSGYTTPARVLLTHKDDMPVPAEVSARLARLFELHNGRVVRYLAVRVGWDRYALAEDLAQELWLFLALNPGEMDGWQKADEDAFPLLAFEAKRRIYAHFQLMPNERERVLGAGAEGEEREPQARLEALAGAAADDTVCAVLELLGEGYHPGWRPCFAHAVAALPDAHREVLELACVDGMTLRAIGARLGIAQSSVQDRYRRALEALRPALETRPARDANGLPAGWEQAVSGLSDHHQKVVRLRAAGRSHREIAAGIGSNSGVVCRTLQRAVVNLERLLAEGQERPEVRADRMMPDPEVVAALHAARRAKQENSGLPEGWQQILDRLPRSAAEVVRLRAADGLPYKEIARRLERTVRGVEVTFHSAARSMRQMVRDRSADIVPTTPLVAKACTRTCASGCSLRTARTEASA